MSTFPNHPGNIPEGTLRAVRRQAELHLASSPEDGLPILEPATRAEYVEARVA